MDTQNIITIIVAIVAILVSISTAIYSIVHSKKLSSSDFSAVEQVKSDTARLLSSLRSIMYKRLLNDENINISSEQTSINNFLNSQTAFAYTTWISEKNDIAKTEDRSEEAWRAFFLYLVQLVETKDVVSASHYAIQIELLFDNISEYDMLNIGQYNSNLSKAISKNSKIREGNMPIKILFEVFSEKSKNGTEAELSPQN